MQHHGAKGGAAHAGIRDAHHIGHALLKQLGRNRQIADLSHARVTARAAVFENQYAVLVDLEVWVVDALLEIICTAESDRLPTVTHQGRRSRRRLDHGTVGSQIPAQYSNTSLGFERLRDLEDDPPIKHLGIGDHLAHGYAGYCGLLQIKEGRNLLQNRWHTPRIVKVLHQVLARGHEIDKAGHVSAIPVPVVQREVNTESTRQREEVHDSIGGAT